MYFDAKAGHVGSSLSCSEIMTFIKFEWMSEGDEFILSKGHAAAVLYSTWAEAGIISEEQIATFYKNGTVLSAHPPVNKIQGIPFATGSLGHGLGIAVGLGLAAKLKKSDKKIFCLTSDGELDEGSTWEAALFLYAKCLNNVVWIIDRNRLQGFGKTESILQLEPLDKKLVAFGFKVIKVNGHSFEDLLAAKNAVEENGNTPSVIIAETNKGNGWKDMENKVDCHYLPMKDFEYEMMIKNLEN